MSTDNKNMDWLNDFKKDSEEFNNTKYASKLTDAQIAAAIGGSNAKPRYDSEYQSEMGKRGGKKGAEAGDKSKRKKHGDNYNDYMKETLYGNIKDKKAFHAAGQAVSSANAAAKRDAELLKDFDKLPIDIWITKSVITEAFKNNSVHNAAHKFMIYHKDKYVTNGGRGMNTRYKILKPSED